MHIGNGWQNGLGNWAADKDVMAVHDWIVGRHPDAIVGGGKPTAMMPFRRKGSDSKMMNFATVRDTTNNAVILVLALPPATPPPTKSESNFGRRDGYLRIRIPRQKLANELPKLTHLLANAWNDIGRRLTV
jgi:hypothetical protein